MGLLRAFAHFVAPLSNFLIMVKSVCPLHLLTVLNGEIITSRVVRYVDQVNGGNTFSSLSIASALSQTFNTIDEHRTLTVANFHIRLL
jgi:hypothetical protein